jgi:hypothetical protein
MNQFIHLVPGSTASLPTDIWIPSTDKTKPQYSTQYSGAWYKNFVKQKFDASIEIYYKEMNNQVLFKEGYRLTNQTASDSGLVYGNGTSYGAEFFLKKNSGKLTGWISYTLSKTDQQFDDLNFGEVFPFKYDRRHVLSTAFTLQFQ